MKPILTISIPTYNRHHYFERLISNILEVLRSVDIDIIINVHDNNSEPPVKIPNKENFNLFKNRLNIGIVGNTLECFKNCTTDWLWIIGDDDLINEKLLLNCIEEIKINPEAATIFFSNKFGLNKASIETNNINSFLNNYNPNNFGGRLWISSQVFNMRYADQVLRYMYAFPSSSPHMIWTLFHANKKIFFSKEENAIHNQANSDEHWHPENVINQMLQVLSMPIDSLIRRRMAIILANWVSDFDNNLAKVVHFIQNNHSDSNFLKDDFIRRYLYALISTKQYDEITKVISVFKSLDSNIINEDIVSIVSKIKNINLISNKKYIDNI